MRDVLVHQAKARDVVKVFAGGMCVRVEIMYQPRGREDPVLKAFVVVTVLRIRRQHTIVDRPRQAGPGGRFRSLVVKCIGSDAQARNGNESVILAIGKRATRFRLEIISHQARLPNQFVAIPHALFFAEVVI